MDTSQAKPSLYVESLQNVVSRRRFTRGAKMMTLNKLRLKPPDDGPTLRSPTRPPYTEFRSQTLHQ